MSCLKKALQPCATNISISFDVPTAYDVVRVPMKIPSVFEGDKLVVYGITKRKLQQATERTSCKAVLSGDIAGVQFVHEILFDVGGLSGIKGDSVLLHQLAAKRMIQEWQDDDAEKHKEDIVGLSIDCSVVSEFTAFVAVDEQQSVPVTGPLVSWMLPK